MDMQLSVENSLFENAGTSCGSDVQVGTASGSASGDELVEREKLPKLVDKVANPCCRPFHMVRYTKTKIQQTNLTARRPSAARSFGVSARDHYVRDPRGLLDC